MLIGTLIARMIVMSSNNRHQALIGIPEYGGFRYAAEHLEEESGLEDGKNVWSFALGKREAGPGCPT